MIAEFEDCCRWMYVVIDDLWQRLPAAYKRRSGPAPACSDSEVLTLALVGECRGWTTETTLLSQWAEYAHLFPILPERSRFDRRRRQLRHALNAIRQAVLAVLDVAQDRQCAIDSLPVPVLQFHLVPSAAGTDSWRAAGADFGKVPTKKQTIFGYKLHLLVTLGGVIRDFVLAPASASAVTVGAELRQRLHQRAPGGGVAGGVQRGAADRAPAQPAPPATRCGHPDAQWRPADHRNRQRATERTVQPRRPSGPHLPGPMCPTAYQARRPHPLPLSQPLIGARRLAPDQGPRLPQLGRVLSCGTVGVLSGGGGERGGDDAAVRLAG